MVEIIPKSFEQIPSWQRILLYSLVFLLIAVIVSLFLLANFQKESESYLKSLKERLDKEGAPKVAKLEEEIFGYKKKIEDFSSLFENHILNTKFFDFIESKAHPQVYFSEISLDSKNSSLIVYGAADSFLSLGQQLSVFRKEELIKKLALSSISIGKRGGIDFNLTISFKEELFRYLTSTPINKK